MMHRLGSIILFFSLAQLSASDAPINFSRDIRPLLAEHCFDCHGNEKPKGGLSFTSRAEVMKGGKSDIPVIVPGDSAKSGLFQRITTADADDVMPTKGERLPAHKIALLKRWIDSGAVWPDQVKHWAYEPPQADPVPMGVHPIDHFVRLHQKHVGLTPAPSADRATLLRRACLDLTGLPPTLAQQQEFFADNAPGAYERVVDRLLASPQFGVRWARPWLDLARYADSHGFQKDDLRSVWPYRDWVVNALNADMPFTQFTVEQLAGDLLPNATLDQRIATGFNRCAPCNVEAGSDPEETRVTQVLDRVNTLGAVWLGTTLECAQCHNHKYDPISQRDYFQLYAIFNQSVLEADRKNPKTPGSIAFLGPFMELTDPESAKQRQQLLAEQKEVTASIKAREKHLAEEFPSFEKQLNIYAQQAATEQVLEVVAFESTAGSTHQVLSDGSILLSDDNTPSTDTYVITIKSTLPRVMALRLETLTDPSLPGQGPGRGDPARPNFVLNDFNVTAAPVTNPSSSLPIVFQKASASFSQKNFSIDTLLKPNIDKLKGWAINPQFHQAHWALFESSTSIAQGESTLFTIRLTQNYGGGRTIGRLRFSALSGNSSLTVLPEDISKILSVTSDKRNHEQQQRLVKFHQERDVTLQQQRAQLAQLDSKLSQINSAKTLVMEEVTTPRTNMMLKKGVFNDYGEAVTPGTPAVLHAPSKPIQNRLDLAQWLTDRSNPLTARVVINRWWAELFGRGIVSTAEDFGIKGDMPTHPDLLDWMAVEFMSKNWSMKHMLRLMVTSQTYQQDSRMTPAALQIDDQNKWLARGPRFRLDAEAIRDNALSIAGLMNLSLGGEPIKPPQPDGLWDKVGGVKYDYVVSPGPQQYRRGLYVIWKRGSPYPSFINFDASGRLACTVKRTRSNTPLQALTLLNDPVYVEAAQAFAKRIIREQPQANVDQRLQYAVQLALGRLAQPRELDILRKLFDAEKQASTEAQAWESIASALLNLDETICKG